MTHEDLAVTILLIFLVLWISGRGRIYHGAVRGGWYRIGASGPGFTWCPADDRPTFSERQGCWHSWTVRGWRFRFLTPMW